MSVIDLKRRRPFRVQGREFREIARTFKNFGLPGPTTKRAVARIRRIASEIEGGLEKPFEERVENLALRKGGG